MRRLYYRVANDIPLRIVIVVPFLIQLVIAVGFTGWLSFRNAQKSVNSLATNLSAKISENIEQRVKNHQSRPPLIHELNASVVKMNQLNLDDFSTLQRYFWYLSKNYPENTFFFGNQEGEFIEVGQKSNGTGILWISNKSTLFKRTTYHLDSQGNQGNRIEETNSSKFDPRTRPWYQDAASAGKLTWSSIFTSSTQSDLVITTVNPVYNQTGKLRGVLGIGLNLAHLSEFLQDLKISKTGQAFIIERSGQLVASSAESPIFSEGKQIKRLQAINSTNPLIQSTAKHLLEKFGGFQQINPSDYLSISFIDENGKKQLVNINPLNDQYGLNWLVVVVIPEEDFMEDIDANTRTTLLFSLIALMVTVLIGLRTSKWIIKPILSLNRAARHLSDGDWEQRLPVERSDEIGDLAKSFNRMTEQLKEMFLTLEQKVKDRTAELAFANLDLEKKNALIRQIFGRYLTKEVVENLLESPEGLKLGGERKKITILTSDLRGFTAKSERLPPEEVVRILNLYLEQMADVITKYQGTIDEFMGDGILVLFGALNSKKDDAIRAIACAVDMQLAIISVNEKIEEWGCPPLEMGIGINTGEVVVGNIGSEKRAKYGVVGNEVNLTYRIESYTVGGQIFISESTLKEAGAIVKIDGQLEVTPKGVQQPITIYEVAGIGGEYNLFLNKEEEVFFTLNETIAIKYQILDGKNITETNFNGSLVQLSNKGAKVQFYNLEIDSELSPLTNIKLNLLKPFSPNEVDEDIYAKIVEKTADRDSFYIRFTSLPPAIKARLNTLYKSMAATS